MTVRRPDTTKSVQCDDWFLTCDFVNRILVVGFDRDVCVYDEHERFLAEVAASCELLGSDFDVVFWCGPSSRLPSEKGLVCFDALIGDLCRAGARQFGAMVSAGCQVDVMVLKARAHGCGHELHVGDTVDTLEFAFGIGRISAIESPGETSCRCADMEDAASVIAGASRTAALRLTA